MMFLELCCCYGTMSTRTVTMVLVTHLVMITSSDAKPMALAHRDGSGTYHVSLLGSADRVKRWSDGQDIPADKQVPCGRVSTCDSRTQFCDDVVNSCGSCEDDVCNPKRYGFEGAKEDCQHYCPEFWKTQQERIQAASLTTTSTLAKTTQNGDVGIRRSQTASSLDQSVANKQAYFNLISVGIVSCFAMFFLVLTIVLSVVVLTLLKRQWKSQKGAYKAVIAADDIVGCSAKTEYTVRSENSLATSPHPVIPQTTTATALFPAQGTAQGTAPVPGDISQPESLDSPGSTNSTASTPVSCGPQSQTSAQPGGRLTLGEVPRFTDAAASTSEQAGKHKAIIGGEPVCHPDKEQGLYNPNHGGSTGLDGEESGLSLRSESTPEVEDASAPQVQLSEQTAEKSRHEVQNGNGTALI